MMENSSYIKPYFYIEGEKVIYPASTWKRIGARFIDIFLVNIFIVLFFAILYSNISKFAIPEDTLGLTTSDYQTYVPQLYSLSFMLVVSFAIFLLIILNLIIPLFNKNNPGQTFGKLLFGITPIFFTKSNKKLILIRELPFTIIIILPLLFSLILGGLPNFYYSQLKIFMENGGVIEGLIMDDGIIRIENSNPGGVDNSLTFYSFVSNYMTNPDIMPCGIALTKTAAFFIYFEQIFTGVYWIFLIVLLISIAFNHQKMGLMDKIANTSVVDLKKIIDRTLIEGDPYYVPNTILDPKDASTSEGPPVELNK